MKIYEIQYTLRFEQQKDFYNEYVNAETEIQALKIFSKYKDIQNYKLLYDDFFYWEEGNWHCKFKCINEVVSTKECSKCGGSGTINLKDYVINKNTNF